MTRQTTAPVVFLMAVLAGGVASAQDSAPVASRGPNGLGPRLAARFDEAVAGARLQVRQMRAELRAVWSSGAPREVLIAKRGELREARESSREVRRAAREASEPGARGRSDEAHALAASRRGSAERGTNGAERAEAAQAAAGARRAERLAARGPRGAAL